MKTFFKNIVAIILIAESKAVIKKYKPKVVTVTGSVGKTSTKDAIYTVLSSKFYTRKSQKSFNSEIGIPLTILGCENGYTNPLIWIKNIIEGLLLIAIPHKYPQWLVLEVGADRPNDIKKVASWLKPDVAVITQFGDVPVHIEFFPSLEDLITEKGHLAHALKAEGIFVFNHDDKHIVKFAETVSAKKMSYGFNVDANIVASNDEVVYGLYDNSDIKFPIGMRCRIDYQGTSTPVTINGTLGKHQIYPFLAACAVGISQGMNIVQIGEAFAHHEAPRGRMRLVNGIADTLIIDDTYNSSPVAVQAGLELLKKIKVPGRKIGILGDMLELGQYSSDAHKRIGEIGADVLDLLITVGVRSRATADAALDAKMSEKNILQFESSREAGKYLAQYLKSGDVIFVKGSQSMRMERAVEELMEHREDKENILVRQDKQWVAKR